MQERAALPIMAWDGTEAFDVCAARTALRDQGALLVRNVLSAEEIAFARAQLRDRLTRDGERIQLGRTQPNAAALAPEIAWLVAHPDIAWIFKAMIGRDACFTGHCDIHMNMLSGWHKDSGESMGGYFRGDYFGARECRVFNAGIYLQDVGPRDGLTVSLGSHRRHNHDGMRRHVPSKAGDVIFFDVRLSHAGQLPDLVERGLKALVRPFRSPSRNEPAWATLARELYWRVIGRRDRLSVFFTYGQNNPFTRDFSRANMRRQIAQTGKARSPLQPDLSMALGQVDVTMADFR
ncbi:phytanoyl-CoA dioxygenase family protein [Sphingobium aquiterrae]|uniref:phytanoyl-CoA dioxygenase family protein n=1 Tax=Sphingobium aquiterrae TaxID=2038656 RepID=UPI00301902C1